MTPTTLDDRTHIVRDRRFSIDDGDNSILAALSHLSREHVTGQLIIDISCGGLCSLRFREERKINFSSEST